MLWIVQKICIRIKNSLALWELVDNGIESVRIIWKKAVLLHFIGFIKLCWFIFFCMSVFSRLHQTQKNTSLYLHCLASQFKSIISLWDCQDVFLKRCDNWWAWGKHSQCHQIQKCSKTVGISLAKFSCLYLESTQNC